MKNLLFQYLILVWIGSISLSFCTKINPKDDLFSNQVYELIKRSMPATSEIQNTLLIVTTNTFCQFCIDEIEFWNSMYLDSGNTVNIHLFLVDNEEQVYQHFLKRHNLEIPSTRIDRSFQHSIFKNHPLPVKIYLNSDGKIEEIRSIGYDKSYNKYYTGINRRHHQDQSLH